jgi:hypothetical protein
MGLLKKIKKRRQAKIQEQVIQYGLFLFGFNLALAGALFFTLTAIIFAASLFTMRGAIIPFIPLAILFLFASVSVLLWYRFGQIIGEKFKKNKILYAALAVFISVALLLLLLIFMVLIFTNLPGISITLVLAFLGTLFITVIAVMFELPLVILGVLTDQ